MTATRFCLVRHGETAWNTERRLQGHLDIPLNDTGRAQAAATADALADDRFHALYTSDLARAQDTAQALAARIERPVAQITALRERHYGIFQGLTYDEAMTRHPNEYRRFMAREPGFVFPGGGESLLAFQERISLALTQIASRHVGEHVLIVTHGGVLDVVHRLCSGKSLDAPRDFTIPNAALNRISIENGRWTLLAWAVRGHLEQTRDELSNS